MKPVFDSEAVKTVGLANRPLRVTGSLNWKQLRGPWGAGVTHIWQNGYRVSVTADTEASLARQANELARDLAVASPRVYWLDLSVTAAVTWLSLAIAATSQ